MVNKIYFCDWKANFLQLEYKKQTPIQTGFSNEERCYSFFSNN